jgi:hypothetical protein
MRLKSYAVDRCRTIDVATHSVPMVNASAPSPTLVSSELLTEVSEKQATIVSRILYKSLR